MQPSSGQDGAGLSCLGARSQSQAPDIDSCVFVHGPELHPGKMLDVKVTDFQAYDLVAQVPKKRSRSLSLLKA